MGSLKQTLARNKSALTQRLEPILRHLAETCAEHWPQPEGLDACLERAMPQIPACALLYALDLEFRQLTANISRVQTLPYLRGQDLRGRPYLATLPEDGGLTLSEVYLSQQGLRPCVTALQPVRRGELLLGFVAADFDLQHLLLDPPESVCRPGWAQYRGDPAIRSTLFLQQRVTSRLDETLDEALAAVRELMVHHGVFHAKLHFSSARMTLWQVDNPFAYRIHDVDDVLNPSGCRTGYRRQLFPAQATVAPPAIALVFEQFKALRHVDQTVYLRSASLNTVNGLVGLTFSCDGSHYLSVQEFLERDLADWLGATTRCDS